MHIQGTNCCSQTASEESVLSRTEFKPSQTSDDEGDPETAKRWAAPRDVPEGITIETDQTIEENI